jgi:hypothetical protein
LQSNLAISLIRVSHSYSDISSTPLYSDAPPPKKRPLIISTEINIRIFLQYWGYSVLECRLHPLPFAATSVHPLPFAATSVHPLPFVATSVHPLPFAATSVHPLPFAATSVQKKEFGII